MINKIKNSILLDILFLMSQIIFVVATGIGVLFLMYQIFKAIKFIVS